jgi:hypothetical protein
VIRFAKSFRITPLLFRKKKAQIYRIYRLQAPIDIYYDTVGSFVVGLMSNNMQYKMAELIKKNNVDLNRFENTSIGAMKAISNGGMYGIPVFNISSATSTKTSSKNSAFLI